MARIPRAHTTAGRRRGADVQPPSARAGRRWLVALAVCGAPLGGALAAPTPCDADEQTIFGCRTAHRMISVCARPGTSAEGRRFEYRFGSPTKAESVVPGNGGDAPGALSGGELAFSGGGGAYLRFRHADVDYVVYTAVSSRWGEQSGVVPQRAGKSLRDARCVGKVTSTIGPDLFKEAGIQRDTIPFDLPD